MEVGVGKEGLGVKGSIVDVVDVVELSLFCC